MTVDVDGKKTFWSRFGFIELNSVNRANEEEGGKRMIHVYVLLISFNNIFHCFRIFALNCHAICIQLVIAHRELNPREI